MADDESWKRWRRLREQSLTAEYGWLTVTSFQWLPPKPGPIDLFPGRWSADGTEARLDALAADGIHAHDAGSAAAGAPEPLDGTLVRTLAEGESVNWVRHGSTIVELGLRDSRYMVRTRERRTPALEAMVSVPTFGHDPAWALTGRFRPYGEARTIDIASYREDARLTTTAVGDIVFRAGGREHRLTAEDGGAGALLLSFHDLTNGESTPAWRFLHVPPPADDGTVSLDFNRTLDYPFAFSPFAVCPAPIEGNRLDLAVTAGERLPAARPVAASGAGGRGA